MYKTTGRRIKLCPHKIKNDQSRILQPIQPMQSLPRLLVFAHDDVCAVRVPVAHAEVLYSQRKCWPRSPEKESGMHAHELIDLGHRETRHLHPASPQLLAPNGFRILHTQMNDVHRRQGVVSNQVQKYRDLKTPELAVKIWRRALHPFCTIGSWFTNTNEKRDRDFFRKPLLRFSLI